MGAWDYRKIARGLTGGHAVGKFKQIEHVNLNRGTLLRRFRGVPVLNRSSLHRATPRKTSLALVDVLARIYADLKRGWHGVTAVTTAPNTVLDC